MSDNDEFIRGDFSTGNTGYDGEGAVALDVSEELVVGVLQAVLGGRHDVGVVEGGKDGAEGGFADFAAK